MKHRFLLVGRGHTGYRVRGNYLRIAQMFGDRIDGICRINGIRNVSFCPSFMLASG
jgi:hypothetical protein